MAFTAPGYPVDSLARLLREFAHRHRLALYMEPGEAVVTRSTDLIVTVLDIVRNGMDIAVVDSATAMASPRPTFRDRTFPPISASAMKASRQTVPVRPCQSCLQWRAAISA